MVSGDPRYLKPGDTALNAALELNAMFTVVELLRNGVTTFVEFGSQESVQLALMKQIERFGTRGYLGPGYDSGRWVGDEHGGLKRVHDSEGGLRGLDTAVAFIRKYNGALDDRIRGLLVPREVETSTVELLEKTLSFADELKVPMATHAAYSVLEFHDIVREHQMTPIELLDKVGMLRTTLNIGHGNFIADNGNLNYSGARDLELMGSASMLDLALPDQYRPQGAHPRQLGPLSRSRRQYLDRQRYLSARHDHEHAHGIADGEDHGTAITYKAPAGEVFEAATLGGARSLGRDDLGRLCRGRVGGHRDHRFQRQELAALRAGARSDQEPGRMRRRRRHRYGDRQRQDMHGKRRRSPGSISPSLRDQAQHSGEARLVDAAGLGSARPDRRTGQPVVLSAASISECFEMAFAVMPHRHLGVDDITAASRVLA